MDVINKLFGRIHLHEYVVIDRRNKVRRFILPVTFFDRLSKLQKSIRAMHLNFKIQVGVVVLLEVEWHKEHLESFLFSDWKLYPARVAQFLYLALLQFYGVQKLRDQLLVLLVNVLALFVFLFDLLVLSLDVFYVLFFLSLFFFALLDNALFRRLFFFELCCDALFRSLFIYILLFKVFNGLFYLLVYFKLFLKKFFHLLFNCELLSKFLDVIFCLCYQFCFICAPLLFSVLIYHHNVPICSGFQICFFHIYQRENFLVQLSYLGCFLLMMPILVSCFKF